MAEDPIPVVIVENEPLYRDLLRSALLQEPTLTVLASFGDGPAALASIPRLRPRVALLDIELGGELNGVNLGLLLRRELRDLGIVLLSNYASPRLLSSLPQDEIAGCSYLLKRSVRNVDVLLRAIHGAAGGLVSLDPALVAARRPREGGRLGRLTERQREILALVAQGSTNEGIASELGLAVRTVENQLVQLYAELGVDRSSSKLHPRVKAVLVYLEETQRAGPAEPAELSRAGSSP